MKTNAGENIPEEPYEIVVHALNIELGMGRVAVKVEVAPSDPTYSGGSIHLTEKSSVPDYFSEAVSKSTIAIKSDTGQHIIESLKEAQFIHDNTWIYVAKPLLPRRR